MTAERFLNGRITLWPGDCLEILKGLPTESCDSCVTDPPYHLTSIVRRFGGANAAAAKDYSDTKNNATGAYARASKGFMGKTWDGGDIAFRAELWAEVLRVLKPGAHLVAFSGTRTYHRMACAIEDAGFEIRDQIQWLYGSGFPKSHDVSKGIDRKNGDDRPVIGRETLSNDIRGGALLDVAHGTERPAFERNITSAASAASAAWEGWGTALKPACEPIVLARKPLSENTVAANVLKWGTGALNINGARVGFTSEADKAAAAAAEQRSRQVAGRSYEGWGMEQQELTAAQYASGPGGKGRWPANVITDGSEDATEGFPQSASSASSASSDEPNYKNKVYGRGMGGTVSPDNQYSDSGSAARFFYTAKADSDDRLGSKHPTVKPLDLMQYLVRLVTPKGGLVLDPFAGTGTTGEACIREGMRAILIEREPEYQDDIRRRMRLAMAGPDERARAASKARNEGKPVNHGPLFA